MDKKEQAEKLLKAQKKYKIAFVLEVFQHILRSLGFVGGVAAISTAFATSSLSPSEMVGAGIVTGVGGALGIVAPIAADVLDSKASEYREEAEALTQGEIENNQ